MSSSSGERDAGDLEELGASGRSEPEYTLPEAACGVLYAVMACDGNLAFDEIAWFDLVTDIHPIFRTESRAQINRMIDVVSEILEREGWKPLVDKCARSMPEGARLAIFSLAVDCIFADGIVLPEEEKTVAYVQHALGIEEFEARSIMDVLALKNGFRTSEQSPAGDG